MTVKKVLLFPSPKGNVKEHEIKNIENKLSEVGITAIRYPDRSEGFDAVIALGGDGTMLKASSIALAESVPIMSVNFGTLGYMSGLEIAELDMLSKLKDELVTEKRMLIDVSVQRDGKTVSQTTALNEAVISRNVDGGIALLALKCDGSTVCDYRTDGLIIATPTGSSAYAMSAGGPIIDTKLDAFCVCPICPHALGARAMVFSPNSVLEAVNVNGNAKKLICDGNAVCDLYDNDVIRVTKSEKSLEIIKLKKDAFYETLYNKMS